jgi:hypothetical protein
MTDIFIETREPLGGVACVGRLPLAQLKRWIEGWLPPFPQRVIVNNAAPAETPGVITDKIEVFDAQGESIGYLAVYDNIT